MLHRCLGPTPLIPPCTAIDAKDGVFLPVAVAQPSSHWFLPTTMANLVEIDCKTLEGVHMLDESSYRKHARKMQVVLTCERCHKKQGEDGVNVRRCTGVRCFFRHFYKAISFTGLQCLGVGFCSKEVSICPTYSIILCGANSGTP